MLIRRLSDCREITAKDGCRLRELLHPDRGVAGLPYSVAMAWVEPGKSTHPHRLTAETEVYVVVRGRGRMRIDEECAELGPGDSIVIPAGARQWIECVGAEPLQFLALVSPPWRVDHDVLA